MGNLEGQGAKRVETIETIEASRTMAKEEKDVLVANIDRDLASIGSMTRPKLIKLTVFKYIVKI